MWAGATFCATCGQVLTSSGQATPWPGQPPMPAQPAPPWYGAVGPYGAPPAGFNPANSYETLGPRPLGIAVLTVVEIVIGIVGFLVSIDLFRWVDYGFTYQDTGEVGMDLVMGLAYLATSVGVFGVAREIWQMRHWVWMRACLLNLAFIGLIVFSVLPWGLTALDVVGIAANGSVLVFLNLNSIRRVFGRSPLALL